MNKKVRLLLIILLYLIGLVPMLLVLIYWGLNPHLTEMQLFLGFWWIYPPSMVALFLAEFLKK